MAEIVKPGDPALDFVLKDQNGQEFRLADFRGKRVLLSFHPLAWTGVSAQQMQSLEKNRATFDSLNTVAVGVNIDSVPSKKAWAESLGIKETRLLADFCPSGQVARLYGVYLDKRCISQRANIIVDEKGKVAFVKVYEIGQLPDIEEIIKALREMK